MLEEQEVNDPGRTNTGWIDLEPYRLYVELGPLARSAVPRLEQELTNHNYESKEGPIAFALWRITGETSPRIINALTRGTEARLERFKLFSLGGLKQIGPPASNAVPALERVVREDHRVLIHREAQEARQAILRP